MLATSDWAGTDASQLHVLPPMMPVVAELEKAVAVNNDAIQAMFDSTKDRCSNEGEDNLAEDVRQLCMQTQPRSMLALMFEKLQKKSKDVALWLCSAAETTVDKDWSTHYSERLACDEAASSTIGAMMSLDDPNQTLIGKIAAVARFTVWSAKFALIVATPFIPLPFGFLGRLFLDAVISQLTGDAEKELDLVEKQMKKRIEEISRRTAQRVQVEEAFRIGSAHARAANDQIKDMAMIDHLWSSSMTAMSEHGASKDSALLWSTMKQVTSFNRWAIIEHDLAMCIEVLMPADALDLEDRATFAKLMKVHFEMYVLVLSHMNAAGDATQNVEEMQAELSKKATRMASITLPQLVLLSIAVEPGQDLKSVHTMFDSDLLPVNVSHAEAEGCGFLRNETDYEFEFLATCVWLPFLRTSEAWATPLPAPSLLTSRGVDTDRPDANSYEYWHNTGPLTSRETPQIEMETEELRIGCAPGQFLAGVEYAYKQSESGSWTASRMQHFLTGACRSDDTVETAANGQFTTAGICTDVVTLFSDHTLAVMISLTFQRRGDGAATIKSSTCQLAYQRSTVGPYLVPGFTAQIEVHTIKLASVHTAPEPVEYRVLQGALFKKPSKDPSSAKVTKLSRKVGSKVRSTGRTWRGPAGGLWIELDAKKPGWLLVEGPGFNQTGPLLEKLRPAEEAP
ncbi:unnamed protein product [Symbiodinium natans]|uniref:Uncharacterized protein n=1 Tax=Symbiodinium natans TaxID=878477 RepID=A0A812NR68_9DINO|nr:unnamed protein product [Symbiodinium natans]